MKQHKKMGFPSVKSFLRISSPILNRSKPKIFWNRDKGERSGKINPLLFQIWRKNNVYKRIFFQPSAGLIKGIFSVPASLLPLGCHCFSVIATGKEHTIRTAGREVQNTFSSSGSAPLSRPTSSGPKEGVLTAALCPWLQLGVGIILRRWKVYGNHCIVLC